MNVTCTLVPTMSLTFPRRITSIYDWNFGSARKFSFTCYASQPGDEFGGASRRTYLAVL